MSQPSPWTTRSDCPVQGPRGAIIPPYRIHAYMLGSSKSSVATHVIPYILLFFRFWRQMFDARVGIKDEPGRAPPPRPRRAGRATCTFFYQLASGGGHSFGRCRPWLRCGGLRVPLVALPAATTAMETAVKTLQLYSLVMGLLIAPRGRAACRPRHSACGPCLFEVSAHDLGCDTWATQSSFFL